MPMNTRADEAFASLVRSMEREPGVPQQQSRGRIQQAFRATTPETIQSMIDGTLGDFDTLLFDGRLSTKIPVMWRPMPEGKLGSASRTEGGVAGTGARLTVFLSTLLVPLAAHDPALVWGTLIHELLHCYALILSLRKEICRCGEWVDHGPGFYAAAMGAVKVLGIKELAVQDLVDFERGLCHADHDEMLIVQRAMMREEDGRCELPEMVQSELMSWWEGIEVIQL